MPKRYLSPQLPTEVTSEEVFFDRRRFLSTLSLGVGAAASQFCSGGSLGIFQDSEAMLKPPFERPQVFPASRNVKYALPNSIRSTLTAREVAAAHNNFYEFLPGKGGAVWRYAGDFTVEPWKVKVTGECNNPFELDLDDIFSFPHQERLYHFRCVERWAMNVPWSGFPLSELLKKADPKSSARYVRFVSALKKDQMPGVRDSAHYPWPYFEALRIDEAMNELAFVATGVYGRPLLKQHGSPLRIVVPWKYGYKNPKSIVKIELVKKEPKTFWQIQPHEYGFISNINPNIPHPRWSQARSYWLDDQSVFETPIFNGYEKLVAHLYPDEPRLPQRAKTPGELAR